LGAGRAGNQACMSSDPEHEVDEAAQPMEDEAAMLEQEVEHLGDHIDDSRKRLEDMPKPNEEPLEGV
jgi:hypothetical protein